MLANANVIKAINSAIDRDMIVNSAYQGHAVKTLTPFNPKWSAVEGLDTSSYIVNAEEIENLLSSAGLNEKNALGYRVSGNTAVNLKLVVNASNNFKKETANIIASQLSQIGLNVEVLTLDFNSYINALNNGQYDLYIGEIRLSDDQSLMPFFEKEGATVAYGIDQENNPIIQAYTQFFAGSMNVTDFMAQFNASMPFIPVCYRYGLIAYTRELNKELLSTQNDNFYNIEKWSFQ